MDYSSIHEHEEHGGSPWNTSPRQTATTSAGTESEPDSPSRSMSRSGHTDITAGGDGDHMNASTISRSSEGGGGAAAGGGSESQMSSPDLSSRAYNRQGEENESGGIGAGGAGFSSSAQQQVPYQQQQQMPSSPMRQAALQQQQHQQQQRRLQQRPQPQYKLVGKITGLEGTGKKDMIFRFDVQTNLPRFRTTQFRDIRRTHGEFKKLADHLISSNPEAIVPAVPPAVTSAGAGTEENEARVKFTMQRWINTVFSNDVLIRDDEMIFFVESDFGYSPVMRMKQPATGVRRKYLKQFAPPPDNTPELFEARPIVKMFYLGSMDAGQKIDKGVKARRALGLAESDLGIKMSQLNVQEQHVGLATAYRKLGRTIQAVGDYHAAQGTAEAATLGDQLHYHSDDAFIVKETLTNRHILLRELQQAQGSTRNRLTAADRLKISNSVRRDKVDEAITALEEARNTEEYLAARCDRVTKNLLFEKRRWFDRTSADLRAALRDYVIRQIEAERRALATLENVRPDIRAIDPSGGLSRLGREQHPIARRLAPSSSQGPRGDAWSGVQRRSETLGRTFSAASAGAAIAVRGEGTEQDGNRDRSGSGASKSASGKTLAEDDEDRIDAKNAASRLAQSTF